MTPAQTNGSNPVRRRSNHTVTEVMSRWPTLAAIGLTAIVALDLSSGRDLAPILAASGMIYLGAAVLNKPAAAWPLFLGTFVVISASRFGLPIAYVTGLIIAAGAAFAGYGAIRRAPRPIGGVPLQSMAMIACGTAAAAALVVSRDVGAYLIAAGLLAHAAWDVYHHRIDRVVVRSMAEFCGVLDTLLAIAIVIVTARG